MASSCRRGLSSSFSPVEVAAAGVMAALPDVQADHDRKACVLDAVLPWSIIAGRSLDTRCRHPRYEETSDELGRVPIAVNACLSTGRQHPRDHCLQV